MTTTDDNHTPDPTPALLSTARLAEIRERVRLGSLPHVAELLAHLDALTPRAAPDGEALGAEVRRIRGEFTWGEALRKEEEAEDRAIGTALHAIGYAAGRSEGEAERVRLAAKFEAICAELRHVSALVDKRDAEIEGLRREVASECALTAELRAMEAEALASADRWKAASEQHEREAAEARAGIEPRHALSADNYPLCGTSTALYVTRQAEAVTCPTCARRDGAREEREAWQDVAKAADAVIAEVGDRYRKARASNGEIGLKRAMKAIRARGEGQGL